MISGTPDERRAAVAHALELGINYFDTAAAYGEGESETHLGQALKELGVRPQVATKILVGPEDGDDMAGAVERSLEGSLRRLQLDSVDVVHLHMRVALARDIGKGSHGMLLSVRDVLGPRGIVEGFERVRQQGKVRAVGFCGFGGETAAAHEVIDSGVLDTLMIPYNLLNPTAGRDSPAGFKGTNLGRAIDRAAAKGMGVVAIQVLGGGALTGKTDVHPLSRVRPGPQREAEEKHAQAFRFLAELEDCTMAQAAIRFVLSDPRVSACMIGVSANQHLDEAAAASDGRALSEPARSQLAAFYRMDDSAITPL